MGFRSNPLKLPGARVAVMLEGWSHRESPSEKAQRDLHPNLAFAVDLVIQRHLRPSLRNHPDFLDLLNSSGKPSVTGTPNSSE